MGLFDRWRSRGTGDSERGITGPEDLSEATVLYQSMANGTNSEPILPTTASLAASGYGGSSVVFSLIAVRMLLFAEAEPRWWNKSKRRFDEATDGLDLLLRPWPGADHGEMQARAELDVSLAGNAFIAAPEGLDRLVRLRPDYVTIQRVEKRDGRGRPYSEVDGYWYGNPNAASDWVFYDVSEVAHYAPYPDPMADYRGMSWLTPVVREMTHDRAMTQYATEFFDHAATPNLIVKYTQNLGREKIREAQEMIRQRHGGALNAYQAMVLDSGADVTIAGNSFEQMNFNSLRAATENRIASAAGVPPMIVGFKEGLQASTLANYDAAGRRLADMTMAPLWRIFASELSQIVRPPRAVGRVQSDLALRYDATSVGALQQGAMDAAETFKTKVLTAGELIRSGWEQETVAEAVEAQDMMVLEHTGKTPTALYDEEGNPSGETESGEAESESADEEGADTGGKAKRKGRPGGGSQGQGAAAPQPRGGDVRVDEVQALLDAQREAMLEAFRAGFAAGRSDEDDTLRHGGHANQKSHGRRKGSGGGSGGEGGGGAEAEGGGGGGTTGTGTEGDPIRTSDPDVAAKALYEDKYVEFTSERAVSTSLSTLKKMIDDAEARGEDKGKLNLCKASMAGSNLFCSENKGVPRVNMPQLSGKPLPGTRADRMSKNDKGEVDLGPMFRDHLASKGIGIKEDEVDASVLKATQTELETRKVLGIASVMREGGIPEKAIFTTQDDYIVDGHHRWAAKVSNEFIQGQTVTQKVSVIQTDILTILTEANEFSTTMGIPQASTGVKGRSALDEDTLNAMVARELGTSVLEWMHGR